MKRLTKINNYESMVVISSEYNESELTNIIYPYIQQLKKLGALDISVITRGRRDFAYAIDKYKTGYFIQLYFDSSPNIIPLYQIKLNLDKNILRSLVINLSKKK